MNVMATSTLRIINGSVLREKNDIFLHFIQGLCQAAFAINILNTMNSQAEMEEKMWKEEPKKKYAAWYIPLFSWKLWIKCVKFIWS